MAIILATLSVSALLGACADDDATTTVQGTPFRARPSDATGVTDLGDAPVTMFRGSQLFWSGSSVLFFGSDARRGRTDTNAGGSFEPSTGTWVQWPDAPFAAPLIEEDMVWTGDELLVVGVLCRNTAPPDGEYPECHPGTLAAAAFNPTQETWRAVPAPPTTGDVAIDGWGSAIGWSGREAVFSTGKGLQALDPRTSRWRSLPGVDHALYCATPHGLFAVRVLQAQEDIGLGMHLATGLQLERLDRTTYTWADAGAVTLPATDEPNQPDIVCGEDDLLVYDAVDFSHVFLADLDGGDFVEVAPPPVDLVRTQFPDVEGRTLPVAIEAFGPDERAWTGSRYVFWKAGGSVSGGPEGDQVVTIGPTTAAFDPTTGTWSSGAAGPPVPGGGANQVVWADGVAYLTQRDDAVDKFDEHPAVVAYRPVAG